MGRVKYPDITGERFGRLVAIERDWTVKSPVSYRCVCDCGKELTVSKYSLLRGATKSCGCYRDEMLGTYKYINIQGMRFERLVAVKMISKRNGKELWECLCDCGNIKLAIKDSLMAGATKSCGCLRREIAKKLKFEDLSGKTFGKLTVIKEAGSKKDGRMDWLCQCACGNITYADTHELKRGHKKSCGCAKIETLTERSTRHGLSKTRIYNVWCSMKDRCFNKKCKEYRAYGGRGIVICEEWLNDFMSFYAWAIESGYKDDLTIERIDVDGNYEPDNCTWTTIEKQAINKRNTIRIIYSGKKTPLSEACRMEGFNYHTAVGRYYKGVRDEDLFAPPNSLEKPIYAERRAHG